MSSVPEDELVISVLGKYNRKRMYVDPEYCSKVGRVVGANHIPNRGEVLQL